ncbi:MAG: vanadium-dependent haloperoxidase [Xanthobacteraceae bacterium]
MMRLQWPRSRNRRQRAYRKRVQAARAQLSAPYEAQIANGDEERYPNYIASFSKCLQHDDLGEVDPASYRAMVSAIQSGDIAAFEKLNPHTKRRIAGPLGGRCFSLSSPDAQALTLPPPPTFESAETAAEMAELYWMSLTRDVPFARYGENELVAMAAKDLSRLQGSTIDPRHLFLANYPGVADGPRVSQFLLWSFDFDGVPVDQKRTVPLPSSDLGLELMTSYDEWLAAQRGVPTDGLSEPPIDPQRRYPRNSRDLGWCADQSAINTTYLNVALLLLGLGRRALDSAHPYKTSLFIGGLGTFDIAHLETLIGQAARAHQLSYQKWFHRRLRPEAFSGRIHNTVTKGASYPIHQSILDSPVLQYVFDQNARMNQRRGLNDGKGTYLLSCLWGEGSPTHPSYPQGHGTAAGIGATLLKAWFDEDFVLPERTAVKPNYDGTQLEPYVYGKDGPALTIGGELNKLAYNITWGRNMSGVHYRSDGVAANTLGEQIAIRLLREDRMTVSEGFSGFGLTQFGGTRIVI